MKRLFDCAACGAHGSIIFKETQEFKKDMIVACPFCASDISQEEEDDFMEEDE